MQATSQTYKDIVADPLHWEETRVWIGGLKNSTEGAELFEEDKIVEISTKSGLFSGDKPTIGGAAKGSIHLVLREDGTNAAQLSERIPRMALIRPEIRVQRPQYSGRQSARVGMAVCRECVVGQYNHETGIESSEWIPQGVYYVDTRDAHAWSSKLTIEGVDGMALCEADFYTPYNVGTWPLEDHVVIDLIGNATELLIDDRTWDVVVNNYSVQLPTAFTFREILGFIAAMYCGNFCMTKEGKLLLVTLDDAPESTNYLVLYNGDRIMFGDIRILLEESEEEDVADG